MVCTHFYNIHQKDKAIALLGGTKFELDQETLDSTEYTCGYILGDITCYSTSLHGAIMVPNVSSKMLILLESSPYLENYYTIVQNDVLIFSLEGLVYFKTMMEAKPNNLEEEFVKNTRRVRLKLLNDILNDSSVVNNATGVNNSFRDELNAFDRLTFCSLGEADEESKLKYLDNYYFNYTGFFKEGEKDDCIKGYWIKKNGKIFGQISHSEESKQAKITVKDDVSPNSQFEMLEHRQDNKGGEFVIHHNPSTPYTIVYNLTKHTKEVCGIEKAMTETDYKTLHGLLSWFINVIQDEFNQGPYSAGNVGLIEAEEANAFGK